MIKVVISCDKHDSNKIVKKQLNFTEELIKDDMDKVMKFIKEHFLSVVLEAAKQGLLENLTIEELK